MRAADDRSHFRAPVRALGILVLAALPPIPPPLAAQDFRFGPPAGSVSVYAGWGWPGESSQVFAFTREQLTVGSGDFAAPLVGGEAALRLTERIDVAAALEHASREVSSRMRHWVTLDDLPITQATAFSRTRLMGSVKVYLMERGRTLSRFAWVPHRWSPYLGAGAGVGWYTFRQAGDFVDFETQDIFEDRFESSGSGTTVHALAGVEVSLGPTFLVRGELRRIWGSAEMDAVDFEGFDEIDLSESRVVLGVAARL